LGITTPTDTTEKDLAGKLLLPGLMDMHVHLRDPGQEYKEDITTGSRAAARGGFTAVLAMPNTRPTIDTGSQVGYLLNKAATDAKTRIYVAGALTVGQKGEALSEMADMAAAGAVAFTDDGRGVQDAGMMRLALEYASSVEKPVLSHCENESLVGSGQVNEGVVSTRLGLAGWPKTGEEIQIARDIALTELTGAALHIQHLTTIGGLDLIRAAKQKGLPVTCEVTPHHLFLDETALDERYDTNLKMNPPLRTAADAKALRAALVEGLIDCLASDHAPHAAHEKSLEFELAPFGVTGLETALALMMTEMINSKAMSLAQLVERMAHTPRRILGLPLIKLEIGSPADLTVIDPDINWQVNTDQFASRSVNSAFIGSRLKGRATDVFVKGEASLIDGVPV
ncbi:MAG: dihydroorotase, partial [Coriobacteriales bacterium]|nr:dihydroorotase [Coriobacteriales bacterium]